MINRLVSQRYEVLEKIGESPLFAVYKARDRSLNRIVALKAITPAYAGDTAFIQGLQSGLAAATRLSRPEITAFYEYAVDEGTPYAVYEFVRGIDLKERIRRIAPFTLSTAIDIACAIGEALHYAHSLNMPHGDIRPQNIVVSPEGAVKVTDFGVMAGVARSAEAQREMLLRAAPYHAPELSTTVPGSISGDIYALGAVLYEMLTGMPVYSGDSPEAIADLQAFAPIPSPRSANPGVPRSIEGIIMKCLQKRPEQRYATAADLLNDLKAVRDALRFGKPLSWSPIDLTPADPVATPAAAEPTRAREPVAVASSRPVAIPANNRLRAHDERVSTVIRVMIGMMTAVILICLIGFVAIYRTDWGVEPPVTLPQMVGMPIDQVKAEADRLHIRLILHGDYMEKPRNIVYKTDQEGGIKIHAGHYINVWYSKGPEYVDVPNVVGMSTDQARQKLLDAGLTVGRVMPEFSNTVAADTVIRQNVSYKKRVLHDTAVDLVFSDGKTPDSGQDQEASGQDGGASNDSGTDTQGGTSDNNSGQPPVQPDANVGAGGDGTSANALPEASLEQHDFDRNISITNTPDHKPCQVRVEFDDAADKNIKVIDSQYSEGEKAAVSFHYVGNSITLRIYYNDKLVFQKSFDPTKSKGRITGGGQ